MEKIILSFCFIFLGLTSLNAQLLNNKFGEAFTDKPFFNEILIKRNQIKQISGKFTMKKVGDIMRESQLERTYEFDKEGRLILSHETVPSKNGYDTLITYFEYDERGNLSIIRKKDQYGFYVEYFEYDSLNRIVREEKRRNINKNANSLKFELGEEFVVSFETSKYSDYGDQIKRTIYNSYDIPFRDEINYYNEEGVLIEKVDKLRRTSGRKSTLYKYNEFGLLDSLQINSNQAGRNEEKIYTFEYDVNNNLAAKRYYRNGIYQTEFQILYDEATNLINYVLTREVKTDYITVLKLSSYIFFSNTPKVKQFSD
jgi:hypothetical protein